MARQPPNLPDPVRDRIFDAVLAEVVESGIDEFSVARVARRAGLDQRVIDSHWHDSRVLLMEAMLARAQASVPIADTGSLSGDLRQLATALAGLTATAWGRKWFRRLLPGGDDADLSNVGQDFWAFQLAAVERIFDRAAERGELRTDFDLGNAARMAAAALAYDMVFADSPMNPRYTEQVLRTFLHGALSTERSAVLQELYGIEQAHNLIRTAYDGIVDPAALIETVRDADGHIIDFVYREVNPAACTYLQRAQAELLGVRLTEALPDLDPSGLLTRCAHAVESGEPLLLEDFPYFSRRYDTIRRFDLRGARVSADWLALVWRDVSERYREHQHAILAARSMGASDSRAAMTPAELADIPSGLALRAVADALLDPQVLLDAVRDSTGQVVDFVYREVNQATCDYLGKARQEILGRGVVEIMPGLKGSMLPDYIRCLQTGEPLIRDNFTYDNEVLQKTRRYDVRVTRATMDSIVLTWRDITDRYRSAQDLARSRDLLRAATDAMFNPQAVVEVMATPAGGVDLVLRDVNTAFCEYIDQDRSDVVDRSMLALFPNVIGAGLKDHYVRCAETGEPVILDDVEYFTEFLNEPRRFDIRAAQVDVGLISLTVRDTTARFQAAQRLSDSEQQYRLLAENTSDAVVHGHNGKFLWVSPAIETVLGAPPEYWIGRDMSEMVPPEDRAAFAQRLAYLEEGGTIQRRSRVVAVDGATHWVHVHASPFFDGDGRQVGFTSSLRVIDDEVAAENAAEDARQAQADADARYRRLVESAKVATATSSADGHLLLVNQALCDPLGYDPQTLLKMNWRDITHPDDLDKATGVVADLIAGRSESARTIGCYVHADGHCIWGDVSVTCTRTPSGEPEQLTAQIIDVTAQVEAERQLAASEVRYRLLAENTGDLVFHVRDGRFAWVSPSVRQVLGASPEYWVGRRVQEIVPPDNRSTFAEHQAILAQGGTVLQRVRALSLDGATHWMHLHARPFRDADGHRDGFIAALRVIDDEVAAQEATEHARAQQARADTLFRRSVENAAIGMCLITPDGRFAEVNDALCRFFGYDAETLTTKTWQELTAPDYLEADVNKVNDVLAGRLESYRMVKQYIHADGTLIWGDLSVSCIRDEHGNVENFISQITDITERVEADEWNRTLSQELQRQNELLHDSEQSYRLLAENATDLITHVRDGRVVWASPSADQILGAPAEYWVGREVSEVVPRADLAAFARRQAILAQGGSVQERVRVTSLDGVTHWMHLHARPFYGADENQDGFIAALRLIDDEVAAQEAAQEARMREARANALYRTSMQNAAVGMCLARPGGALLEVNEALCAFFGYDAETLLRKTWIELTAPEYLEADLHHVADLVAGRNDSYRMVKQYVHADGHRLWGDLSVGCVRREDGSVEVLIKQITDITAQVEAEERLERLARVDPLTGLVNRREAIARMESALQPTEGPPSQLGVLFCDIDGFKGINDKLGHAAGDVVLSTLASRIRQCVRDSDTVGRMGGDEILVLLPGMPDIDRVNRVAEKIRRHAAESIRVGGQSITVTLSIGAVIAAPGQTMSTVLARADTAMYAAKARKNAVASFPSGEPS